MYRRYLRTAEIDHDMFLLNRRGWETICISNIMVSSHVETVVCLSYKNAKRKDYIEIDVDADDYYSIKDSEKA